MNGPIPSETDLRKKIKEALLREWDPIGVMNILGANREYDGYIPKIYEMIVQRSSKDKYALWHLSLLRPRARRNEITAPRAPRALRH
jgi:IS30 family transposase